MSQIPDSGDPGDVYGSMGFGDRKPEVLTDATWQHMRERFAELRELSDGGQALVFEGKEKLKPHRWVAIKVYRGNSADERRLFEREVAMVGSPHLPRDLVVGLYAIAREGNIQPYLVLERINGREPLDYVQSPEPLSMLRRIELFATYCRAMQRLHDCNLVLRDVSARNVLIEPGDRVRFIDFAGATRSEKGYENASASIPIATHDSVPIEVVQGEIKASKQTDLFAAAGIGFLMLTSKAKGQVLQEAGITDENHAQAQPLWDAELTRCEVPPPIRQIVLKGLQKADPRLDPDPGVYAKVEQLADDIAAWKQSVIAAQQSVERRRQFRLVAALLLLVAIPGLWCWWQWQQAKQASNLVVSRRLVGELQQQTGQLALREHPAVKRLLEKAASTGRKLEDAQTRGESHAVSLKLADEMQSALRSALNIGREIERGSQLREAIGKVLLEDEATEKAGFWVTAAPMIGQRRDELHRRYVALAEQIQAGQTASLAESLARLQADLGELFRINIEARSAFDARFGYRRGKEQVPERLLASDRFREIDATAQQAEKAWEVTVGNGDKSLSLARSLFGIAQQDLDKWLRENLNPEELAALEKDSQARVAELEVERQKLLADVERQTGEVRTLNEQFTKLTQERLDDQQKLATATTTLASEQKLRREAEAKAVKLDETQKKLSEVTATLEPSVKRLDEAKQKLTETTSKLAVAEQERDRHQQEAARWKKLAQENPGVRIAINEQLATIEQDIGKLDPKNWDAAHAALGKAAAEYRRLEAERAELVKPNAFEPKHPKVRAKDAELADAEALYEKALKKRDDADKLAFAKLQQQIDARQKLHDDERALGVAEQNAELVQLRSQIAALKQTQVLHADGAQRAQGQGKQPTLTEMLALAGASASGGLGAGTKAGDRRVMRVRGFDVAFRWCPPGPFQMGSPASEAERSTDEGQVAVTLTKGFWMLETEVTQDLWTAFMGLRSDWTVGSGPKYPAYNVTHDEAIEFCRKINDEIKAEAAGKGILVRLPTEAEWEYACRAGTKTAYSFGNDAAKLGDHAWHSGNSNNGAHPVGQKQPNDWGLRDMHGNLWEWCSDWYDSKLSGGTNPTGPSTGSDRCFRGGGWGRSGSGRFRSAYRNWSTPSFRAGYLGFRVAAVPQQ